MFYPILQGVKVVEYGNLITAPFCAKILADLGAEVIKIEDPEYGDVSRRMEPFIDDIPGQERSGLFLYLNMNKLGITLNVGTSTGKEILKKLLRDADVFIEDKSPVKSKEIGIDYSDIESINPHIIMTSITPFGLKGPYNCFNSNNLVNANMGGNSYISTREVDIDQEPLKPAERITSFQAGLSAAVATMGALYNCSINGSGEHIDFSEQESAIQNMVIPLYFYSYNSQIVSRTDRLHTAPFHILPCKDGYIYHAFVHEHQWQRFLEIMGNPDWADNELFKDYETRGKYWDALRPLMINWTMEHTMDEIYRAGQEKGAPVGVLYTAKDILKSKQLAERGFMVEIEHPETGHMQYPGVPYRCELPLEDPVAAPMLGQHNKEIYCGRLGYSGYDLVKLNQAGVI